VFMANPAASTPAGRLLLVGAAQLPAGVSALAFAPRVQPGGGNYTLGVGLESGQIGLWRVHVKHEPLTAVEAATTAAATDPTSLPLELTSLREFELQDAHAASVRRLAWAPLVPGAAADAPLLLATCSDDYSLKVFRIVGI